jgi:hypothetical protein
LTSLLQHRESTNGGGAASYDSSAIEHKSNIKHSKKASINKQRLGICITTGIVLPYTIFVMPSLANQPDVDAPRVERNDLSLSAFSRCGAVIIITHTSGISSALTSQLLRSMKFIRHYMLKA